MIRIMIIVAGFALFAATALPAEGTPAEFRQKRNELKKQNKSNEAPAEAKANYGKYEFSFKSLEGRTYHLKNFSGKITLVNLWAPWCEPCKEETNGLVRLYKKYRSKGFEVIGIAVQTTPLEVRKFMSAHGVRWPVGIRDNIIRQYKPVGIPASYLFDRKGNLVREFAGYADENALDALLLDLFKNTELKR